MWISEEVQNPLTRNSFIWRLILSLIITVFHIVSFSSLHGIIISQMCKGIIRKEGKKRIESRHPSRLIHWIFHLFYFNSNFSFLSLCLSLFIKTKHPFSRVEELLEEVESSSRHPSDPLCWGSAVDPARKPKILHAGIDNPRLPRLLHRSRDSSARERGKRPSANACLRIHHREPRCCRSSKSDEGRTDYFLFDFELFQRFESIVEEI